MLKIKINLKVSTYRKWNTNKKREAIKINKNRNRIGILGSIDKEFQNYKDYKKLMKRYKLGKNKMLSKLSFKIEYIYIKHLMKIRDLEICINHKINNQ